MELLMFYEIEIIIYNRWQVGLEVKSFTQWKQ